MNVARVSVNGSEGQPRQGSCLPTVVVADRSRRGLRFLAQSFGVVADVWGAQSWEGLLHIMDMTEPRAVVVDLALRGDAREVVDALPQLGRSRPGSRIVLVGRHTSVEVAVQAVRRGAHGVLAMPAPAAQILEAAGFAPSDRPHQGLPALTLDAAMWEYMNTVIEETGSLSTAAKSLGVDRRSLRRMLARYRPATSAG